DRDFEPWLFGDSFGWPRRDVITGTFGDKRMYNGKLKSQHYGLDLDGETGDPIVAANDGEVVMVRECFGSGNTVVVHHGGRLFTT
ncbi:M23 family metallopeptidase, partial [Escherichia coli]|uniref:M23 family metallopeptidase n=1 Tax=Escherichia coli TaxID=562 RepID=UPI0038624284